MQASKFEVPPFRRLRVYAFDPSLALRMQTAAIQEITIRVPWESNSDTGRIEPGPVGEYLEVVDVDPASGLAYAPIDLDDLNVLAQDGLPPSEGNPQFHQQMVYAVAMATIGQFERALGRVALWAPRRIAAASGRRGKWNDEYVQRLRIYPHALRDRNAYYSPAKKALLFGYFPVQSKDAYNTPGTTVFTCLSHDVIAHEVTHALLDGIHPRFNEPSNPDVHAFHEAFADMVALFQHFSYPGVLRDQIGRTRGNLESENLLGQLAQEFGRATGRGAALRDALGHKVDGVWRRRKPDPHALESAMEPHARGAILVAAVFTAFVLIYRMRTADLFRIATQGTGVLPDGDIPPDLTNRLAEEASRTAQSILQMCVRALDYCPPVDITFGTYLRAIVTGDVNYNPGEDSARVAMIESFREWGIFPRGIRSMSIEALTWPTGAEAIAEARPVPPYYAAAANVAQDAESASGKKRRSAPSREEVRSARVDSERDVRALFTDIQHGLTEDEEEQASDQSGTLSRWDLDSDRSEVWNNMQRNKRAVWLWLVHGKGRAYADAFGLVLDNTDPNKPRNSIYRSKSGAPSVEVHSVRTAMRRDARGAVSADLVIEITQRRAGYFDRDEQKKRDAHGPPLSGDDKGDFKFRTGCTVIVDTTKNIFRHIIRTPGTVADDAELEYVRQFLTGDADATVNAFDGVRAQSLRERRPRGLDEPFAMLHRQ